MALPRPREGGASGKEPLCVFISSFSPDRKDFLTLGQPLLTLQDYVILGAVSETDLSARLISLPRDQGLV